MNNFEFCKYTMLHRMTLKYLVEKRFAFKEMDGNLYDIISTRISYHDCDKLFLYQFLDKKSASKLHREVSPHHMENNISKSYIDYLEAVLDYESAGYTKPDKPLNAYDTICMLYNKNKISEEDYTELIRITKELGIDCSYRVSNFMSEMIKFHQFSNNTEITEKDILDTIQAWLSSNFLSESLLKMLMLMPEYANIDLKEIQ